MPILITLNAVYLRRTAPPSRLQFHPTGIFDVGPTPERRGAYVLDGHGVVMSFENDTRVVGSFSSDWKILTLHNQPYHLIEADRPKFGTLNIPDDVFKD